MPHGYVWQYEWIRWIQTIHAPWLERVLHYLTILGTERFYVIVLPVIFWGISKQLGLRLAYVFLTSMFVNGWMKDALRVVRPMGIPGIQSSHTATATGYAMPSGHAQGSITFWGLVARWVGKAWFWILALLLAFGIGASRVYFGLHWPLDVMIGWLIGLVFVFVGWGLGRWWSYRQFAFNVRMTFAVGIPLVMFIIHTGTASAQYASLLLGIGVGAVMEERWLGLELSETWWKRVCAVVIGMAGLIALQWFIKWPADVLVWIIVRDVLIGLWATFGAPYVFLRSGLYQKSEASQ